MVVSGSVVISCKTDNGICMRGEEELPRKSPGSRSVNPESGIDTHWRRKVLCPKRHRRGEASQPGSGR